MDRRENDVSRMHTPIISLHFRALGVTPSKSAVSIGINLVLPIVYPMDGCGCTTIPHGTPLFCIKLIMNICEI